MRHSTNCSLLHLSPDAEMALNFVRSIPHLESVQGVDELHTISLCVAQYVLEGCNDYQTALDALGASDRFRRGIESNELWAHIQFVLGLKALVENHLFLEESAATLRAIRLTLGDTYAESVATCIHMDAAERSLLLSELVAQVALAEGTPEARASIRFVAHGKFELRGTERRPHTFAAAFANVKRALERLRSSSRLKEPQDRLKACVPSAAFAKGDPLAVSTVFAAVAAALTSYSPLATKGSQHGTAPNVAFGRSQRSRSWRPSLNAKLAASTSLRQRQCMTFARTRLCHTQGARPRQSTPPKQGDAKLTCESRGATPAHKDRPKQSTRRRARTIGQSPAPAEGAPRAPPSKQVPASTQLAPGAMAPTLRNKVTQTPPRLRRRPASELLASQRIRLAANTKALDELSEDNVEPPPKALIQGSCAWKRELEIRSWLATLGVTVPVYSASESRSPLRDPSRNGAILCELALRRQSSTSIQGPDLELLRRGRSRPASTIGSASRRARAALEALEIEDTDFWCALSALYDKKYEYAHTLADDDASHRPWLLPYNDSERESLAQVLSSWLGIAGSLWTVDMSDGTTLRSMVLSLTKVQFPFSRPTTRNVRYANIAKAFGVLRDWHTELGWRHPDFVHRAVAGDWGAIFPLLDDCYRLAHRQPARAQRRRLGCCVKRRKQPEGDEIHVESGDALAPFIAAARPAAGAESKNVTAALLGASAPVAPLCATAPPTNFKVAATPDLTCTHSSPIQVPIDVRPDSVPEWSVPPLPELADYVTKVEDSPAFNHDFLDTVQPDTPDLYPRWPAVPFPSSDLMDIDLQGGSTKAAATLDAHLLPIDKGNLRDVSNQQTDLHGDSSSLLLSKITAATLSPTC